MKILHVCPLYYPAVGGVENVFRAVSEGLVRRGQDVMVFTTTGRSLNGFMDPMIKPLPANEVVIHGVKIRRYPYRRVSRLAARAFAQGWSAMHLPKKDLLLAWSALPWVPDLSRKIAEYKPDVVLAGHFLTGVVMDACKAKKIAGFPLLYHTALHLDTGIEISGSAFELLKMGDAIWVNTPYEKDYLVSEGIEARRILELGVGIYPEEFKNGDGKKFRRKFGIADGPIILFVGRKEKEKGIETLVNAMRTVWKTIPEAKLILAGTSARYSERRLLAEWTEKYRGSVISIDNFKDEEKKDLYDACDIFVLPSRIDSFGIVYLEAWISGKPVIGADIGSTRSIINEGWDGYLVEFGDSETLAEKITYLLEKPHLRRSMGERGREKVLKRYTWEIIVDKLLDAYKNLV